MTQLLPPKKEVALALLERSNVDVYLDPRAKGVVVPPQFRKEPRLILKIGLNMPVPIPDLHLDEESVSCTLSFNRSPFYCVVPWSSVFAMVGEDGRGMVWPDDVPQELAVKVVEPGDAAAARPGERERDRDREGASAQRTESGAASSRRNGNARATKLVEDAPVDRAGGRAGSKRKKKKDETTRPVLVAVASPPSSASGEPSDRAREGGMAADAPARPREIRQPPEQRRRPDAASAGASGARDSRRDGVSAITSAPQRSPSAGAPGTPPSHRRPPPGNGAHGAPPPSVRPKRELPPYLRVVK